MQRVLRMLAWPVLAVSLGLMPASAQYFDVSPMVHLPEVPRFTVPFTIEVRITNAGPDQAVGVNVTHTVPAGLTILSAEVYGCVVQAGSSYCYDPNYPVSSSINGNVISCQAGRIPAGWYRPIFIRVVGAVPGSYTHQTVIAPMPWELPGNNSINFPVQVRSHGVVVKCNSWVGEPWGSNAVFTVHLVPSNSVPVTVSYHTLGLSATADEDFAATNGSLAFPPGVTNHTVLVPVLDDSLHEPIIQEFTLQLTNAVNAEVDPLPQTARIVDDEPALQLEIIDAAPVLEGDGLTVNALFTVRVLGMADVPVLVDYTASAPVAQNGTLTIPARATNQTLSIPFNGNLAIESNRVFQVTLSNPRGTASIVLNQATAEGTIVDDDATPGKFHHLTMDPVPSPQIAGRAILVTLRAYDYLNNPATNVPGTVDLGAYDFGKAQPTQAIPVSNFVAGVSMVNVIYTNATTNAHLTAWLWMGSYYVTASAPNFKVIPPPNLFIALPASGVEGDGVLAGAGRVSITNVDVQNVEIALTSGDPLEIVVPTTVTIPVGQTSAVFNVTIVDDTRLDATHATGVGATAPGYVGSSGSVSIGDNETATLGVVLPGGLYEMPGNQVLSGTVTVSRPVDTLVQVSLTSSDPTELVVPPSTFILDGQTNGTFWISVRDDALMDGPQPVTVTAHVPNWISGGTNATVNDNDTNLTLTVFFGNKASAEGVGTVTNALRVQLPGTNTVDVAVQLNSSDLSELTVPPGVLIPAGQVLVMTNLTVVDDLETDGNQNVTLTGSSPGLTSGTRIVTVFDNDPHHFVFTPISNPRTSGVPFLVSFSARDVNDAFMSFVDGPFALSAHAAATTLSMAPTNVSNLVRGSWTGNVTIHGWGTNVQVRAAATNGTAGLSNPFELRAPASLAQLRITRFERSTNGLRLYFPTLTGLIYRMEWNATLSSTGWTTLGTGQTGNGAEMFVPDPGFPFPAQRFYRLSVVP